MEDKRKALYNTLSEEYNLGTYEDFTTKLNDESKRRALYDAASQDYDLGTYEDYSKKLGFGPTYQESLDAFRAEHGSWLNDFEARDSAETKKMVSSSRSGLYIPTENAISGEERKRYMELRKQEEALKKAWFTSDEYLAQKDADALFLSNVQKDLSRQRVEYAQANPSIKQEGLFQINPYAVRGVEADTELERFATASRLMDDAIKMHNAPSRYDDKNVFLKFGKGAGDVLSDADFWTAGLTEIADNLGVRDVLSTVQEKLGNLNNLSEEAIENILSPAEKAVLQAWAINTQEQLKRKDDLSRAYQAGQGATESLGFMAEFALTGGIGKAATEGVEQMAKWLGKKAFTKVGGMTDDVAAKVLKETGEKIAQSTVGKYGVGLAESLAEAAGRTGVMPSTFRNISEKATEIETDENGNNYLIKMNDAFAKGYVDSFIENLSEGGRVNALGTLFGDVAGKIPAYKKMVDKFSHTKASELWDAFNSSGVMNTLRAGGWHGLGEEYLEEWYGNALRTLTGVDKEALKDFATVDNQIVTLTSFLPMTIFGGTVSTAQVLSANKDLEKKAAALKSALMERGYDEAQANNMIDMMRGAAPAEVSETLTPIVNSVANRNTNEAAALMKPVGEFAAAVQRWQSFNTKYNYQEQEQRDGLRAQMEENLGQFWQQDENGRQTVQRGVNEKGEVVYMLGKPSVEDVEAGVTSEVAAVTSDGRKVFVNPSEYQLEDELEMNTFLGNEIMAEKGNQEQARMIEEKEAKIAEIRETAVPGTAVNIGTAEAPMQAIVLQRNPDGVIVNTPDGQTRQMTYEEFGNYVGVNAVPMTDAQIDEHEADVLTADRAQREAALDQEYENEDAALEELSEAEDEIEQAVDTNTPLPMKADGSVDQTALWNKDPERWAQWNDEQRQDGGANSLAYVSGAIAKEQAKITELQAAYAAESDFDARSAMESEIAAAQDRLNRLIALQKNYAPLVAQQGQSAQTGLSVESKSDETHETNVRQTVIDLYNDAELSEEEIEEYIKANISKSQSELVKHLSKAPKMGTDISQYKEKRAKHAEKTAELEKQLRFWKDVHSYVEVPTTQFDMEPQNALEFAARELSIKDGIKLQPDSFKRHTGYGSEIGNFLSILRTKEKGGLTLEAAGERLMELDRENNTGFFDQGDPNAGLNAILDVLGGTRTSGDISGYIKANREQTAKEEVAAARNAMMEEVAAETQNVEVSPTYQLSDEVDENGRQFVLTSDGSLSFGEITEETGLTPAPILLSEGLITNPATNDGYGLVHIEARHGDQIRNAGYSSVVEFIEEVANNYEVIREGKNRDGHQTYMLQLTDKHNNTLMVELSGDGTYWNINTAGIFKTSYGANRKEVYNRHTTDKQSAVTVEASQVAEQSDTQPTSSMNASTTSSEDKDSNIVESAIESEEKVEEIGDIPDDIWESSLDEDMPDFTNSASAYFPSEDMRQKFSTMRARINDWAQKLGVQVRIMETLDDVANQSARQQILAGRKVYGYFDPATGEVAFYLPDFLSLDGHELTEEKLLSEIDKTYIHEVVSHRGLRGLLGEEKYGELCDMVWDAMTEQQKANFLNYPGVNGNTRTAADEFIAHFAENVDYNDNRTLWDKIVDFIKDFFNSVELPAGISNESLAELLRHSYRNLAKSAAAIDTNANQQAEGNTVLRAANGSLVGLHNISEDKLRKVLKQGGLANPSTAVVNISEYLLDGYGEISLIMPSSLVDASTGDNIGTYTGDAWTPTYPPISRKVDDRGWEIIKDRIRAAIGEESALYSDIVHGVDNYLDDNHSSKMEFVFLKEKGIEPEIAYKGADGFVGMRNLEAILGVQGLRDGLESYERYKNASPMAKRSFNMWLDADGNKQSHRELKEQLKKEPKLADVLKLNEDVSFADFNSFTYNIFRKEQDAGKIDTYDTMGAAASYVDANNLRGEFEAWLESLMEQAGAKEVFFAGYTRSGERIYKDNTLENVSRHMRLQGRTNAYDDHGLSATKSVLLQRLTSLSQIRKNRARLQNEATYNKEYDALKDRLWSIISQLADMQEISSNQFMNVDYAESRLQEAFTKRNPIAHLNKEYGYDIDPAGEYADKIKSFIKDVQQMPAKYFETKFERPVYLNEFAAAVMPATTSEDIKQAVSEAGLPIFEYDSSVDGSRKEATLKATEGEGIRFRTIGEKGAANLDKAEEASIRLDNLAVARQMEKSGKDAKAIKLATGWERGVDKLWRYEVPDDFDLSELESRLQESLNDGLSKAWGIVYPSDLGELTKSYPDFNVDIMVWVGEEFENTGEYSPATEGDETTFGRSASIEVKAKTVADIKDVLVHEIQHAIQEKEGFAEGGSVFGLKDKLSAELDKRVARIKELREDGRDAEADELMSMSKGLAEAVINNDADTYQNYRKLAGEVEARNVSARVGMSEQERRESLLSETEDVAREDQIVLMDGFNVNAKFIPSLLSLRKAANKIKSWMVNDIRNDSFEIPLPNRVLNKIRSVMGRDFDSHNITANGLAHALKNHGEGGKKLSATSIPIRKEDMELVPYIMTAPDRIEKGSTKNNRESVRFIKNISNGYVVVIEKEFDNSADDLETINMWAELSDVSNATRTPDSTSETPTIGRSDFAKIRKDAEDAILSEELNRKKVKSSENGDTRFRITPEQDKAYMDAVEAGDMEAAQGMVYDAARAAGYNSPTLYHGTDAEFTTFDKEFNDPGSEGFFFTNSEEMAASYGDNIKQVYLRVEDPYVIEGNGRNWNQLHTDIFSVIPEIEDQIRVHEIAMKRFLDRGKISQEQYDHFREKYYDKVNFIKDESKNSIFDIIKKYIYRWQIRNFKSMLNVERTRDFEWFLQQLDSDVNIIFKDITDFGPNSADFYIARDVAHDVYVTTNPKNIKSADPVAYDDEGNIIPLSERFNPENEDIRFRVANENQAIFVSNAAKAVEGIKQEKATPEQWLKMIEKNGGLKAGEDKWMGLSDWLKESDKKTLTKQDVLDFINENMIQIEEVHYAAGAEDDAENTYAMIESILQEKFGKYIAEYYEQNSGEDDDLYGGDSYEYAMDKLREEMNDEFPYTIERSNSVVYLTFPYEETDDLQEWADKLGIKFTPQNPINYTRLDYTTDGLTNKHEIALTVPTIEPWNERDEVHFGDAGDGRAVAWIRFGEIHGSMNRVKADAAYGILTEFTRKMMDKYGSSWNLTDEESVELNRLSDNFREAQKLPKILVIDEIQSKRHQEGREKGYRVSDIEQWLSDNNVEVVESGEFYEFIKNGETDRRFSKGLMNYDIEKAKRLYVSGYNKSDIPDAPFDKNWHELAMKRMLRYAAENGYDVVAWTKGEQQAERYNIGKVVDAIYYGNLNDNKIVRLTLYGADNQVAEVDSEGRVVAVHSGNMIKEGMSLAEIVGKEIALKIMNNEGEKVGEDDYKLSGEGLRVGGEGMKGFYDRMLPAFMNKYGKKWGVKVEDINFPGLEGGITMHSVPVTEEMKESVMEGQVMFRTIPITQEVQDEMDAISATAIVRGNYLKAPNGADTNLTPEQWAMVRTKAFKAWFGDWEKAARIQKLRNSEDVSINGDEIAPTESLDKKAALEYGKKLQGFYTNRDTGASIQLQRGRKNGGVNEVLQHNYKDAEHLQSIAAIPQIIEKSIFIESVPNADVEKNPDIVEYQHFVCGLKIGGEDYTVHSLVAVDKKGDRYYDHNLTAIEKKKLLDLIESQAVEGEDFGATPGTQPTILSTYKGKQLVSFLQVDASKVVDANGEPKVVFHGSNWRPILEEPGKATFKMRSGLMGRGAYFTDNFTNAADYAREKYEWENYKEVDEDFVSDNGYVTEAFLNIRNEDNIREYYGETYYLATDPSQIKSATDNTGEFSADNNDIRFRTKYDVNTNPTEAQKKAGNYKMGHIRLDGYNITIENPKGSVRRGTDSKGNAWENTLNNDYGYIRGTEGVDGDHIDVYLSDNPTEGNVFVIDQVNPGTREFDEHKVMYGFNSAEEAREAYLANFSEGWNGLGNITEVSKDEFKKWIESSHRKIKPFSEYKSVRANEMQATDESELRYRVVSDQETLDRLNSEPTIKVYRAMQLIDGKLYPPMSAKVDGELRQPIELGQWEEAEERPDLVDEKGRFKLDKGNKSSLKARYNPYFHTSPTPLNDQFSSAQTRPELVTVEVEVPESELTSGYKAEKAKDSVGKMEWKAGVVQSKLSGTRTVILSRWDKPVRIVPDSEVADVIVDMFEGRDITMPSNVVTPSLRAELEKRGIPFVETDNQGNPVEEVSFHVTGTPTDEVVANGLQLTPAQTAEVAANIFAALPEESRKRITEGLNGNILGLKDAILQIPTSLASKENWTDEDKQMADVVAEEMTKIAGEITRPLSAEEGLWLLYNNLNKGTDLISQASRALVQRNLGFDAETLAKQEQAKEGVRFRTVGDATSNAQASLYNRGAVNVWTRLKESYVDMMASVEELVKAIEKRTGKVAQGFENILLALNQQSSKGLAAMESYTQKFLNPMFDEIRRIMDETKMKYEDVVRYVILKHGLERNKKLAQRDARAHYQDIYDDIISKITGMTAAQKRTYLTNAHLKEADAKAELATLQAVDMSAMTDEEKREHKKKLVAARKAVEEAEEHLKRAQKIASMSEQEAQDELDKIFEKIENGTDSVFKEMRENDYSGISSMFYDQLGVDRKNFSTEEQYQAALMEAKKDRYSSLKDIETAAEAEVKSFEGKTDTKELWKRINAATKETLRQQYEANMISKDQYLNLRDMFEYYVPLRGFKDNTAEDMYTYYRKPNSTGYTKPILGAEGRKTEAESPFGWIAAMAGSAIASNVKNEAKLALYYFVSNRPENGIATISKTWFVDSGEVDERGKKIFKPAYPPFSEDLSSAEGKAQYEIWQANMKELQKKGQAYEAGQRLNLGNAVVNISDANKPEHIVNVKVGGKDYTIIINGNPRAAQAINGDLNIEGTAQDYSALFGPVLRWMSSVNTSYNPEFWVTNMMRDMAFTMMAVNIKEDPAYRRKFKKNYLKAFKVVSLVAKNEKGTIGDSYLEEQYKDFVKYGGVTGYTQIKDSETWEREIENYLSSNDPKSVKNGKVMRGMKSAFHAAHRFGESLEQVSRFAAFLTARETGKSINEAINDAKEITINFNRKGSGKMITLEEAKYLTGKNGQPLTKPQQWMVVGLSSIAPLGRRFIMFFNAAIQGLNTTYKLMKKNPQRFTGWALGYAAVGMMNAVLHAMLDDDDDYLDIPQYERRNSLMIGGNGAYFKWALPQEARAFYALGDLAVETVMGRNPHQNFLGEALKIGTEILPVNPSEGWKAFMPSVAIPFIELALNEDYKGAPIYNDQERLSEEEKERTAKWSSAYQGTGWAYVKIAQGLNFITSGDKHDAGWINLQPEKLEHLVQSAFGGTIRTADKFINTISAALDPEEPMTIRQTPFLNRFLTINDERFKNVHVNDVFDYYKADAEHALTLEKRYIEDRDMDSLTKLRSSDEYQWAKIYGKYKKPLKAIQEKINVADGTAERKELMKQQDELKKRMIKEISEL